MVIKRLFRFLLVVLLVALLIVTFGSFYMLRFALKPSAESRSADTMYHWLCARYPYMEAWTDSMKAGGLLRDTLVLMPTGERHHALYVPADSAQGRTAIVIHGYKDNGVRFLYLAKMYRDMGYQVLLPDLHGHGGSEGDDIQMGWKDRSDILHWIDLVPGIFGTAADSVRIVVHGVSMGAATAMCVSGEPTPPIVCCFVEDCGYTSVWDEFGGELKAQFSLPRFPWLYGASLLCKARYGWSFKEASPLKQVAKCTKPMLFIHGGNDDFVPTSMVYPLYEAHPGPSKQLWIGEKSGHAMAFHDHPGEYCRLVGDFCRRYLVR